MAEEPKPWFRISRELSTATIVALFIQLVGVVVYGSIWVILQGETDRRQNERLTELEAFRNAGGRFTQENANARISPLEIGIAVMGNDISQIKEMLRDMRDQQKIK